MQRDFGRKRYCIYESGFQLLQAHNKKIIGKPKKVIGAYLKYLFGQPPAAHVYNPSYLGQSWLKVRLDRKLVRSPSQPLVECHSVYLSPQEKLKLRGSRSRLAWAKNEAIYQN
jgi:hypothetical protein